MDLERCGGVGFPSCGGLCTTSLLRRLLYLEDAFLPELIASSSVGERGTSFLKLIRYDLEVLFRLEG